jgi:HAMP domain-containing protein
MKIKTKIIWPIAVLFIVMLSATSLYNFFLYTDTLKTEAIKQLETIAELKESHINDFLLMSEEHLRLVVGLDVVQQNMDNIVHGIEIDKSTIILKEVVKDFKNESNSFFEVLLIDSFGTIIATVKNDDLVGRNKKQEKYFIDGIKGINISRILIYEGKESVVYSAPILTDHDDSVSGVMIVIQAIDGIYDKNTESVRGLGIGTIIDNKIGLGETGESLMAYRNEEGDAVFFTERKFKGNDIQNVIDKEKTEIPITQALLKNENTFLELRDYRDIEVVSVTRYIEKIDAGLVVKIDTKEIVKPINNLLIFFLIKFIVVLIIVILSINLTIKTITKPIKELVQGVDTIKDGNLKTRIKVYSKDEVGQLSESFNEMAEKLHSSYENLEQKVDNRTKELKKANNSMVGREIKMMELKKEIEKLKKKIND